MLRSGDIVHRVDRKEAIPRSLPPDNGLSMPDSLPTLGEDFWKIWRDLLFRKSATPCRSVRLRPV